MSTLVDKSPTRNDLESVPLAELQRTLASSANGLTQVEAARRLDTYGANELAEKTRSPVLEFLGYFWGPIPWMIEAAVVLSALVGHWADFGIILLLLVANAGVGFWEEYQAGNAIAALKSKLALKARVRRDGDWASIAARDLVPGAIIRVRLGDSIAFSIPPPPPFCLLASVRGNPPGRTLACWRMRAAGFSRKCTRLPDQSGDDRSVIMSLFGLQHADQPQQDDGPDGCRDE